jgi:hypothetical protein
VWEPWHEVLNAARRYGPELRCLTSSRKVERLMRTLRSARHLSHPPTYFPTSHPPTVWKISDFDDISSLKFQFEIFLPIASYFLESKQVVILWRFIHLLMLLCPVMCSFGKM